MSCPFRIAAAAVSENSVTLVTEQFGAAKNHNNMQDIETTET